MEPVSGSSSVEYNPQELVYKAQIIVRSCNLIRTTGKALHNSFYLLFTSTGINHTTKTTISSTLSWTEALTLPVQEVFPLEVTLYGKKFFGSFEAIGGGSLDLEHITEGDGVMYMEVCLKNPNDIIGTLVLDVAVAYSDDRSYTDGPCVAEDLHRSYSQYLLHQKEKQIMSSLTIGNPTLPGLEDEVDAMDILKEEVSTLTRRVSHHKASETMLKSEIQKLQGCKREAEAILQATIKGQQEELKILKQVQKDYKLLQQVHKKTMAELQEQNKRVEDPSEVNGDIAGTNELQSLLDAKELEIERLHAESDAVRVRKAELEHELESARHAMDALQQEISTIQTKQADEIRLFQSDLASMKAGKKREVEYIRLEMSALEMRKETEMESIRLEGAALQRSLKVKEAEIDGLSTREQTLLKENANLTAQISRLQKEVEDRTMEARLSKEVHHTKYVQTEVQGPESEDVQPSSASVQLNETLHKLEQVLRDAQALKQDQRRLEALLEASEDEKQQLHTSMVDKIRETRNLGSIIEASHTEVTQLKASLDEAKKDAHRTNELRASLERSEQEMGRLAANLAAKELEVSRLAFELEHSKAKADSVQAKEEEIVRLKHESQDLDLALCRAQIDTEEVTLELGVKQQELYQLQLEAAGLHRRIESLERAKSDLEMEVMDLRKQTHDGRSEERLVLLSKLRDCEESKRRLNLEKDTLTVQLRSAQLRLEEMEQYKRSTLHKKTQSHLDSPLTLPLASSMRTTTPRLQMDHSTSPSHLNGTSKGSWYDTT